ncbi:hypothetical protein R4B61_01150 [Fructilactobacillus vespulae]|uniref:hypothetical protein n=1 Tax=Fructilactobacillus vespulae TaxID=1249630 RepID=UPI0039B6CC58
MEHLLADIKTDVDKQAFIKQLETELPKAMITAWQQLPLADYGRPFLLAEFAQKLPQMDPSSLLAELAKADIYPGSVVIERLAPIIAAKGYEKKKNVCGPDSMVYFTNKQYFDDVRNYQKTAAAEFAEQVFSLDWNVYSDWNYRHPLTYFDVFDILFA